MWFEEGAPLTEGHSLPLQDAAAAAVGGRRPLRPHPTTTITTEDRPREIIIADPLTDLPVIRPIPRDTGEKACRPTTSTTGDPPGTGDTAEGRRRRRAIGAPLAEDRRDTTAVTAEKGEDITRPARPATATVAAAAVGTAITRLPTTSGGGTEAHRLRLRLRLAAAASTPTPATHVAAITAIPVSVAVIIATSGEARREEGTIAAANVTTITAKMTTTPVGHTPLITIIQAKEGTPFKLRPKACTG